MTYLLYLLIAVDQFFNAVFGGFPDETISYRSAQARDQGKAWGCILCKVLDAIKTDHCTSTQRSKWASVLTRYRAYEPL